LNASIVNTDDSKTTTTCCRVVDTSRVYGPEANNIFGQGFFSLQVQVSQSVAISSTFLLWSDAVQDILDAGFDVVTGGQSQFRSNLRKSNSLFSTVVAVEVRRGLSPPVEPPSGAPSLYPSTNSPSMMPTTIPSVSPTYQPSTVPSLLPSSVPTVTVSTTPTFQPSLQPTDAPIPQPRTPSPTSSVFNPTFLASIDENNNNDISSSNSGTGLPAWAIALIVGAGVMLVSVPTMLSLLGFRHCTKGRKRRRHSMSNDVALSKQAGGAVSDGFVPPREVELDGDQQSLAETSLGDRTAGGWDFRNYHMGKKSVSPPSNRYKKHVTAQPLGSFDENSLYTTPFSVTINDEIESEFRPPKIFPLPTPSSISSHPRRLSDSDSEAFSTSDSRLSASSDNLFDGGGGEGGAVAAPVVAGGFPGGRRSISPSKRSYRRQSLPIDCDSNEPYEEMMITRIEPLDSMLPTVEEHDDFALDPEDLDVWSYDYDDMEGRQSESLRGNPTSLSSTTSTAQINNTKTNSFPTDSTTVPSSILTNKKNVQQSQKDRKMEPMATKTEEIHSETKKNELSTLQVPAAATTKIILKDLVTNTQTIKQPSSKSSQSSKKSLSSMKTQTGSLYRLGPTARTSTTSSTLSDNIDKVVNPLTRLFESFSLPSTTHEEIESEERSEELVASSKNAAFKSLNQKNAMKHVNKNVEEDSVSLSDDSAVSASPWLLETVEQTLGPPSNHADIESLSGVSNRSHQSGRKLGSIKNGSEVSYGSRISSRNGSSVMSAASSSMSTEVMAHHGNEISIPTTKNAVQNDLKRLERQLASLEERGDANTTTSSVTMTTITGASLSTISSLKNSKSSRRKRVVVMAPPGKLGVILADRHDGKGTVVSELRPNSPLEGALSPGDKLVAVDDIQVDSNAWTCSQITSLIAKRAGAERRLTVLTR
jgi:hypothetical protein